MSFEEKDVPKKKFKKFKKVCSEEEEIDDLSIITNDVNENNSDSDTEISSVLVSQKPQKNTKYPTRLNLKDIPLNLACEWKECDFETTSMATFINHVSNHIPEVEIKKDEKEEEYYVCLWNECFFESENPKELTRHINFHSLHTKLKYLGSRMITHWQNVDLCKSSLDGKNTLPDLTSEFVCLWENCLNVFTHPLLFYEHVRTHCVGPNDSNLLERVPCKWLGCKTTYKSFKLLNIHTRSHTQEKTVACPECGALFTATTKLYDHLVRQSYDLKYQCKLCSKCFATKRLLREHMRTHVNIYKCVYCDMTCPKPHMLSRHILIKHLDSKPFKCEFCEYKATSQQHINNHILTHYSHNNYHCQHCEFTCRSESGLKSHFHKEHGKGKKSIYCCHLCEEKFSRGAFLTKHLISNHNFNKINGNRFRYKLDEDGFYRLQTVRYTSWNDVKEMVDMNKNEMDEKGEEDDELADKNNFSVLISIEEVDENGKIFRRNAVETHLITELPSDAATIL